MEGNKEETGATWPWDTNCTRVVHCVLYLDKMDSAAVSPHCVKWLRGSLVQQHEHIHQCGIICCLEQDIRVCIEEDLICLMGEVDGLN